ncbi:hypothetical protein EASAB2608_07912 [Streptomyces sp. EAS-AB2608]|uniref:Uncharacterized protein n=1 Tax=Streptomyces bangladeshensis TaxID=295352 RepID=A0ABN3BXN5_9ACTN|nr:hypothetical protein EASAB2608_07912 [Streptomyces sp. EAS-AB2608]
MQQGPPKDLMGPPALPGTGCFSVRCLGGTSEMLFVGQADTQEGVRYLHQPTVRHSPPKAGQQQPVEQIAADRTW